MNRITYILFFFAVLLQDSFGSALVGGPHRVESVDPSILKVLKSDIQEKNILSFSGISSGAKLELSDPFSVTGTTQVVAGIKYDLEFKITAKLVCDSADKNCERDVANRGPITFQCSASFVDTAWKNPRFDFKRRTTCQESSS